MKTAKAFPIVIMRDCCTSGNCFACIHLPYGQRIRVEQFRTTDKALAATVMENWRLYNPTRSDGR